jgi:uncharacterized protein (DUF2249 family)
MAVERLLDVSQLEPCEPLQRTLAALTTLARGEYLRVLHRMEPHPLYRLLTQQEFAWLTQPGETVPVEIFIWYSDDAEIETMVKARAINS